MVGTKQLFLSKRVVTDTEIFNGGIFVNENGVIEDVLNRKQVDNLISEGKGKIDVIDGGDLALMAGVVDSHVHVNEPGRTAWEGFRTATNAAAAGGITTIIDMPLNSIPPTTTLENLKTKANSAKGNVYVDIGFWGGVIPGNQNDLRDLIEAGVVGFKCFLCPSGVEEFPNVSPEDLALAFKALEGTDSVLAFHAELEYDADISNNKMIKKDPEEYNTYLESRPPKMELNAINLVTNFIAKTDVRFHIVHVSSASVVPLLEKAREERLARDHPAWRGGVTAETCHHYLSLSAEEIPRGHSEYKCAPPIRNSQNKEKLWKYLLSDKLDMVVSDHSPCTPELKCSNNLEAWGGISSVQFGLSLFWTQANARGLDMRSITKYLSIGPATLCGLQHRKGALKKGLDADLIFFDPDESFEVTPDIIRHKNKLTPYIGKKLNGVVKKTYLRGNIIYADGEVHKEPTARRIKYTRNILSSDRKRSNSKHICLLKCAVSEIVCKGIYLKEKKRQLFLSRHVVTESGEFDGGILVDENGIIESVITHDIVDDILANDDTIQVVDGGKLALMAGVIDSHVHVNEPGRTSWEGYVTATRAAAVGGITTIVDMPLNSIPPTTTLENLRIKAAAAKEEIFVDVAFWGGVVPGNEMDLLDLINAGVVGFKGFLINSGVPEFPNIDRSDLDRIFYTLNGTNAVLAFHAELPVSDSHESDECEECNCPDPELYSTYLATKPPDMELAAVSLIAEYIPNFDVHVHVVHVSNAAVVPVLEQARKKRLQANSRRWRGGVTAETCHHYLTLSSEQIPPGHTEFKCSPPIRNSTNKAKLWQYIKEQRLDLVASDHSPSTENLKGLDFLTAWGGISSVQFGLSLFWTEAKARGYNLSAVSHYLSSGPAYMTGLYERKGILKPGLDADLIFFDPNASFLVTPETIVYKNKISPYLNRVLQGKVIHTYVRGELIYSDGEVIGEPKGKLLLNEALLYK